MMRIAARYDSPLGGMTMACEGEFLTGLWFDGQRHFEGMPEEAFVPSGADEPAVLALTRKWLDSYFSGSNPGFTPPLKPEGTPFQQAVWRILLTIPYGKTITYGEIATTLADDRGGAKPSARAVGNAVGHNPISLIIPCHRVVGASGRLTGYAAGLDRKASLLALEQG